MIGGRLLLTSPVSDSGQIQVQDRCLFLADDLILLGQGDDLAEDFDIETFALSFVVYLFDIAHNSGFILLQTFNALDDSAQARLGGAGDHIIG